MSEDKINDSETTDASVLTKESIEEVTLEEAAIKEAEKVQEEFELPAAEGSEVILEEEIEAPIAETSSEVKEEVVPPVEAKDEEKIESFQKSYADGPFLADSSIKTEITPKWNWGAMAMPIFFGVANRSYLGLLGLLVIVPWIGWIFGIVWAIVFGLNGERWALENSVNRYRDEEEFRKIMDGWNRAGLVAFIIGVVFFIFVLLFLIILGAAFFNSFNSIEQIPY